MKRRRSRRAGGRPFAFQVFKLDGGGSRRLNERRARTQPLHQLKPRVCRNTIPAHVEIGHLKMNMPDPRSRDVGRFWGHGLIPCSFLNLRPAPRAGKEVGRSQSCEPGFEGDFREY